MYQCRIICRRTCICLSLTYWHLDTPQGSQKLLINLAHTGKMAFAGRYRHAHFPFCCFITGDNVDRVASDSPHQYHPWALSYTHIIPEAIWAKSKQFDHIGRLIWICIIRIRFHSLRNNICHTSVQLKNWWKILLVVRKNRSFFIW